MANVLALKTFTENGEASRVMDLSRLSDLTQEACPSAWNHKTKKKKKSMMNKKEKRGGEGGNERDGGWQEL
jgi:hypothetical protein